MKNARKINRVAGINKPTVNLWKTRCNLFFNRKKRLDAVTREFNHFFSKKGTLFLGYLKSGRFGMKVHEMQIDGINWIEYGSFEAFHEGVRLKKTLQKHRLFFRTSCSLFGGDRIYANNKNRRYCKEQGIQTCFIPKGRRTADKVLSKQQNQLRQQISKERATRLEGSFGNKKNHYLLDKIKGRNAFTEFAWIFFGNLTANAVAMTAKKKKNKLKNKAPCEQLTLHQVA